MDDSQWLPISDEQAKAVQEVAKLLSGVGSFFKEALGSVPQDLVGYLGGDWLRLRRVENIAKMLDRTRQRLAATGVTDTEPASLTLALPILRGAADESREELLDLWARLMAAALDPAKAGRVRQGYAEAISKMDPMDTLVLTFFKDNTFQDVTGSDRQYTAHRCSDSLGISVTELGASVWNLTNLGLVEKVGFTTRATAFGHEFLRVVVD
ncbi:MAG: DUF4393 domain-containing protein [Leptolyngbya sp.]|nr:DUF4393 domain-containing protein [Candidatus Melainabacteria bacterium]